MPQELRRAAQLRAWFLHIKVPETIIANALPLDEPVFGEDAHMIKNQRTRRISAVILVVLGAILMLLAPQAWPGALILGLGIALELAGIALEHKTK